LRVWVQIHSSIASAPIVCCIACVPAKHVCCNAGVPLHPAQSISTCSLLRTSALLCCSLLQAGMAARVLRHGDAGPRLRCARGGVASDSPSTAGLTRAACALRKRLVSKDAGAGEERRLRGIGGAVQAGGVGEGGLAERKGAHHNVGSGSGNCPVKGRSVTTSAGSLV
jgi:hypothetical protein